MKGEYLLQLWPQILFYVPMGSGAPSGDKTSHTYVQDHFLPVWLRYLPAPNEGLQCLLGSLWSAATWLSKVPVNFIVKEAPLYLAHNQKFPTGGTEERGISHLMADLLGFHLGFTESLQGWAAQSWGCAWVWLLGDCNKTPLFDPDMQNCAIRTGWQIHARKGHDLSHQN